MIKKSTIRLLAKQTLPTGFAGQKMYPDRSLFLFSENNVIRKYCKGLVEQRWFEYLVILTIIANCVSLALEVHLPQEDRTRLVIKMAGYEPIFLAIFTTEAILKIVALGFIGSKSAYLRSVWNILDFIVVTSGLLTANLRADSVNLRTLRAIRVLRPFKLVSGVPSLQVVLTTIIKAMAPLFQIGILVLFAILIFAIVGLEIYRGIFHSTCWKNDSPLLQDATQQACYPYSNKSCSFGYTCRPYWDGPLYGFVSFDNIGYAMLTVFQCITMEGWTEVMYQTNKANGSQWNVLYYVLLIIFGSFFMLNLVLGVLSGEFAKERERVEKRRAFLKLRETQRIQNMFEGYMDWMEVAEEIIIHKNKQYEEERRELIKNRRKTREWMKRNKESEEYIEELEEEELKDDSSTTSDSFFRYFRGMRPVVRRFIRTQFFYWTVIALVLLNTVCVSLEHYGQPKYLDRFLFYAEYSFLGIFMGELFIKILGLGFRDYFRSNFNVFDFIVVAVSLFEAIFQIIQPKRSFGFSALRCIRLLRLLKLTRYWSSLRNLVFSLLSSMRSIISLLLLLGLFIFILTLLGMQLFGGDFNFDQDTPTLNFDTFPNAIITVFVILTGENWNEVMYDGIRSQMNGSSTRDFSMIYSSYFLLIVVFGNYTLLNVFLAIAVDNLANAAELSAAEEEETKKEELRREEAENEEIRKLFGTQVKMLVFDIMQIQSHPTELHEECGTFHIEEKTDYDENPRKKILPYSSLFIFGPRNFIRRICHFIANLRCFDLFIMMVIFASSIALATEDPVVLVSLRSKLLENFDLAFTTVFLIELVLKVIDLGLIFHPGSYMRDPWNLIDMTVVIIAVFSLLFSKTLNTIKSLRVIRVLRPLKTINRVPKLKAVFETIISSIKNVFNILIAFLLFQFIFGVVAVQLFSGRFFFCNDPSRRFNDTCKGYFFTYNDQMVVQVKKRVWKRNYFHYDNIVDSMITLFTVTTGEGWPDVLKNSICATFSNEGPIQNYKQEISIFYIVFFIVFPFFFVNIFVALIIVTFQEQGESDKTDSDLDKNQTKCIDFAINTRPTSRYMPPDKTSICYKIWLMVVSTPFEYLIMMAIALNSITLIIKSHTKIPHYSGKAKPNFLLDYSFQADFCSSLKYLNMAFTVIFTLECFLKLVAYRFKYYFKDPWNIFDFITVLGSLTDIILSEIKPEELPTGFPNLGFLRLFRVMRLIKVLMKGFSIRILLWTFIQSFKALPWVCLLIGLLFFIYCIIGMQIFGNIELNDDTQINTNNNFRSFFMGLLLLFRCATGESWHLIMIDTAAGKGCACISSSENGTCLTNPDKFCGSDISYPYFITFILVTTFLMLNLFVAVIMDNFDYLTRDPSILGLHHLDEYVRVWAEFDPMGKGWLYYEDMYKMMKKLGPPVGFGRNCPRRIACFKLIRMNMVLDNRKRVNFNSTLFALIRESLQIKMGPVPEIDNLDKELRNNMLKVWPQLNKRNRIDTFLPLNKSSYPLTVGKIYAGNLIMKNWKRHQNIKICQEFEKKETAKQDDFELEEVKVPTFDIVDFSEREDETDSEKYRNSFLYYFPCYNDYRSLENIQSSVDQERISYESNVDSNDSNLNIEREVLSSEEKEEETNDESLVIFDSTADDTGDKNSPTMVSEFLTKFQQFFSDTKNKLLGPIHSL